MPASSETTPLLGAPPASVSLSASEAVRLNFSRLGVAIGLSHAAVATSLTLGTVVLGLQLGDAAAGTDRAAHAIGAMVLASATLLLIGAKRTMSLAVAVNCVVIGCHVAGWELLRGAWSRGAAASASGSPAAWATVLASAVLEGLGAAWLWTAQGAYLGASAAAVAACELRKPSASASCSSINGEGRARSVSTAEQRASTKATFARATAELSGSFGLWYLGLETMLRFLVSVVMRTVRAVLPPGDSGTSKAGVVPAYAMLGGLSIAATAMLQTCVMSDAELRALSAGGGGGGGGGGGAVAAGSLRAAQTTTTTAAAAPPSLPPRQPGQWRELQASLAAATRLLLRRDGRLLGLLPFQIVFGILTAVQTAYMNATLARNAVGVDNLGYLSAILVGSAALLSIPLGALGARRGKRVVMLGGFLLCAAEALLLLGVPQQRWVDAGWAALVPLFIMHGACRAVYETTNKAVIADTFQGGTTRAAAFSVTIFFGGGATAIALFVIKGDNLEAMLIASVAFTVVAVFTMDARTATMTRRSTVAGADFDFDGRLIESDSDSGATTAGGWR
jgi:hypothetical protein